MGMLGRALFHSYQVFILRFLVWPQRNLLEQELNWGRFSLPTRRYSGDSVQSVRPAYPHCSVINSLRLRVLFMLLSNHYGDPHSREVAVRVEGRKEFAMGPKRGQDSISRDNSETPIHISQGQKITFQL